MLLALFSVNVSKPIRMRKQVFRRNLQAINIPNFSSQAAERLSQNTQQTDPSVHYNTVLHQLLNELAPPTTLLLPDRPSAPWYNHNILSAKRVLKKNGGDDQQKMK